MLAYPVRRFAERLASARALGVAVTHPRSAVPMRRFGTILGPVQDLQPVAAALLTLGEGAEVDAGRRCEDPSAAIATSTSGGPRPFLSEGAHVSNVEWLGGCPPRLEELF